MSFFGKKIIHVSYHGSLLRTKIGFLCNFRIQDDWVSAPSSLFPSPCLKRTNATRHRHECTSLIPSPFSLLPSYHSQYQARFQLTSKPLGNFMVDMWWDGENEATKIEGVSHM